MFTPSPALIARGINVDVVRARLREHGEIISRRADGHAAGRGRVRVRSQRGTLTPSKLVEQWQADGLQCAPLAADDAVGRARGRRRRRGRARILSSGHYVRVDLARLDELMRMIGNLVILRSRLDDTLARSERHLPPAHYRAIQDDADAIERELRELREGVMRVRLVPVGEIFRRMPFVVRDLARETGRSVNVVLSGQDTKIDKFLVERMMDPVLHLVRNAVSHGIETPAEREAAGKPPAATLRLSASAPRARPSSSRSPTMAAASMLGAWSPSARRQAGLPVPAGPAR